MDTKGWRKPRTHGARGELRTQRRNCENHLLQRVSQRGSRATDQSTTSLPPTPHRRVAAPEPALTRTHPAAHRPACPDTPPRVSSADRPEQPYPALPRCPQAVTHRCPSPSCAALTGAAHSPPSGLKTQPGLLVSSSGTSISDRGRGEVRHLFLPASGELSEALGPTSAYARRNFPHLLILPPTGH